MHDSSPEAGWRSNTGEPIVSRRAPQGYAQPRHRSPTSPFREGISTTAAGRSSGFRIVQSVALPARDLPASNVRRLNNALIEQWICDSVPGYSGGTATDLHRLPYSVETTPVKGNSFKHLNREPVLTENRQ